MAFTLSGGKIIQSGTTDMADWENLKDIDGVTFVESGTPAGSVPSTMRTVYKLPYPIELQDDIFIDPDKMCFVMDESLPIARQFYTSPTSHLTVGEARFEHGLTTYSSSEWLRVTRPLGGVSPLSGSSWGVQIYGGLEWFSGTLDTTTAVLLNRQHQEKNIYGGKLISRDTSTKGLNTLWIYSGTKAVNFYGLEHIGGHVIFSSAFDTSGYVHIRGTMGTTNTTAGDFDFVGLESKGYTHDVGVANHPTYAGNDYAVLQTLNFINPIETGGPLKIIPTTPTVTESNRGKVLVWRDVQVNISDLDSEPLLGSKYYFSDYNNGLRANKNGFDATYDRIYSGAGGNAEKVLLYVYNRDASDGYTQGEVGVGANALDYRSLDNDYQHNFEVGVASYLGTIERKEVSFTCNSATSLQVDIKVKLDPLITEMDHEIAAAYTAQESPYKAYDQLKSILVENYLGEKETIVTRVGDTLKCRDYAVNVKAATGPATFDGSTITLNGDSFVGNIETTNVITLEGAVVNGIQTDVNGTRAAFTLSVDTFEAGSRVTLFDASGALVDSEVVTGDTYSHTFPDGYTGVLSWTVFKQGYSATVGSYNVVGVQTGFTTSARQECLKNVNGEQYSGQNSGSATVALDTTSIAGATLAVVTLDADINAQAALDELHDFIATEDGAKWLLANGADAVPQFVFGIAQSQSINVKENTVGWDASASVRVMANVSDTTILAIPGIGAISFDAISLTGATLEDIEASDVLATKAGLQVINTGVQKASKLIPHSGAL